MFRFVDASFFNRPHCHTGHSPVVLRCKSLVCKIRGLESGDLSLISSSVNDFFGTLERSAHLCFPLCPPTFFFLVCSHNKLFKVGHFFNSLSLCFLGYCGFLLNCTFWNKNKAVCSNFHGLLLIYNCYDLLPALPDFI